MFRNSRSFVTLLVGSALGLCLSVPPAFGQATPWLAEPGTGTVNISYTNQNATEFFRQTTKVKGPLEATKANLAQNSVWFGVNYRMVNALSGIDIGGEGFSPSRFPGLQEDAHIIDGRLLADVTDTVSVHGFVGRVVAGRNTAASLLIGVGLSFAFGGGGVGF